MPGPDDPIFSEGLRVSSAIVSTKKPEGTVATEGEPKLSPTNKLGANGDPVSMPPQ